MTRVVRNLHELALRDPRAFTCTIARAFPGFAELRGNGPRDESPLRATAGAGTFASLVSAAEARARPHPEALAFVSEPVNPRLRLYGGVPRPIQIAGASSRGASVAHTIPDNAPNAATATTSSIQFRRFAICITSFRRTAATYEARHGTSMAVAPERLYG